MPHPAEGGVGRSNHSFGWFVDIVFETILWTCLRDFLQIWLHLQTIQKFLKIHVFTNDIQSEYPFQMFKYLTNCVGIYTVCLISNFKCAKWSKHFTLHNSKDISYNISMLINVWCNPTCTVRNKNHLTSVSLN